MTGWWGQVPVVAAIGFAAASGALLAVCAVGLWRRRRLKQALMGRDEVAGGMTGELSVSLAHTGHGSLSAMVIRAMEVRSRALDMGAKRPLTPLRLVQSSSAAEQALAHAGLAGVVSTQGYWDCSLVYAAVGVAVGGLAGAVFSLDLALLLGAVGAFGGFRLPRSVVNKEVQRRADDLERSLSEMLEVVALGLRSGLSFENALGLYVTHFDCPLAAGMAVAQAQWGCGLVSREEALRTLAASYRSLLFGRVVETIIRAIRFGSSLADNLDDAAREARAHYRTARQESVAKAPVKMMLPTSALILPAMLILVLGPVLLELMG